MEKSMCDLGGEVPVPTPLPYTKLHGLIFGLLWSSFYCTFFNHPRPICQGRHYQGHRPHKWGDRCENHWSTQIPIPQQGRSSRPCFFLVQKKGRSPQHNLLLRMTTRTLKKPLTACEIWTA